MENIDKRIINNLLSSDNMQVISTLKELHETGKSEYLPTLIDIAYRTDNEEVEAQIFKLLSELKQNSAREYMIDALKNEKYVPIHRKLVISCWECGLDFGDYIDFFAGMIVERDYWVAFEAFVLIEHLGNSVNPEKKQITLKIIEKGLAQADEQRRYLLEELMQIIPDLP